VSRAPWLVVGAWLAMFAIALPMAHVMGRTIAAHLDRSLAAGESLAGVNFDWWNEFLAQAGGLGQTFVPAIIGFAAVLRNLSGVADAVPLATAIAPIVGASLVMTLFLSGGMLDRLARDRAVGSYGFFAACGAFFFRFIRLTALAWVVYGLLFTWLHPILFERVYGALTRDVTVERTAFLYRLGLYAIFAAVLMAANVVFDYARIRMVVEDRRSAVGGLGAAWRFMARQPGAVVALYLVNTAAFLVLLAVYALVAPGVGSGIWMFEGLLVGQLYIIARVILRTLFAASQIALFQSRLAHAGYMAAPVPVWPDSATAEAIRPQ
jgi:hypothetical protein